MTRELLLAAFIMGVGLCVAGAGTHLYQALARQQAMLRIDGHNLLAAAGHLAMSVVCGPYIMLHMGWQHGSDDSGTLSMTSALIGALVAFTWAFVTGLFFMSLYVLALR
ncbi:MAG: hypothetical protein EOP02_19930 [Proteobacteria bacterium]|nr:MAG: hypothetical protein EOP02_19930 [Pseudomonadota bacterium]